MDTEHPLYHYRECGLDNVFLANGFSRIDGPRGGAVQIHDVEGLHRAIGLRIVRDRQGLTGREFRFLRHEQNLTQLAIAAILGVNVQSVARWEKDRTAAIPGPAQRLMRLLFEEHADGGRPIGEALRQLAELDEARPEPEAVFEVANDAWQLSDAAA